jgi:hypothetical protein
MYLESSSGKNNAYYKKFGFEIKRDIYLGADVAPAAAGTHSGVGPVRLTIMVREPRKMTLAHSIPIKLHSGFSHRAL